MLESKFIHLFVPGFITPLQSHSVLIYFVKTLLRTGNNLNDDLKIQTIWKEKNLTPLVLHTEQ